MYADYITATWLTLATKKAKVNENHLCFQGNLIFKQEAACVVLTARSADWFKVCHWFSLVVFATALSHFAFLLGAR